MSTFRNGWGVCLFAGAGLAVGALGLLSLTRKNNSDLRKTFISLLSHGLDLKDQVTEATEIAKESIEDVMAEAVYESEARKMNANTEQEEAVEAMSEKVKPAKKAATKRSRNRAVPKAV